MAKEPVLAPTVTTWIAPAHDHDVVVEPVVVVEDVPASE